MTTSNAPPVAKKKGLPFKRTVARKRTRTPSSIILARSTWVRRLDCSDDLRFFSRAKDNFEYFGKEEDSPEREVAAKQKEPASHPSVAVTTQPEQPGRKRKNASVGHDSEEESAFVGSGSARKRHVHAHSSPSLPLTAGIVRD